MGTRRWLPAWMLVLGIATATACHGEYREQEINLPPEVLDAVACPSRNCLIVEKDSTFCVIDPPVLREGAIFAHKSRLQLAAGVFPLRSATSLSDVALRLDTKDRTATLSPMVEMRYRLYGDGGDRESGIPAIEWLEVNTDIGLDGERQGNLLLRLSRWPHRQFRLGNPQDSAWFFAAGRTLMLRTSADNPEFPGLAGLSLRYVPCAMPGSAEQQFRFRFAGGDTLALTVRYAIGSHQLGFFVASLIRAQGEVGNETLDISDLENLGLFGSNWSGGEATIPVFALRTRESGETCGLILDSSEWESDNAVNGYVAYEMACDETRGRRLPLEKVSYPDFFALP